MNKTPTKPGYYLNNAGSNGAEQLQKVWVGYHGNNIDLWLWEKKGEEYKPLMPVKQVHPSRWHSFLSVPSPSDTHLLYHEDVHFGFDEYNK
jgi:hypothetical protein